MSETSNETKAQEFLQMVQAGISALDFRQHKDAPAAAGSLMFIAITVSKKIPEDISAYQAFLDFSNYRLSCCEQVPQEWLGPVFRFDPKDVEVLIDGVWQPENLRWKEFPFDDSVILEALALLKERQVMKTKEVVEAIPWADTERVRKALRAASAEGYCELEGKGASAIWLARGSIQRQHGLSSDATFLNDNQRPGRTTSLEQDREKARASERQRLLRHIRKSGGSSMGELSALLPRRARSYIIKRLKELAAEGVVELVGNTKAAAWHPTTPD
jgi:hypothetical protein